MRATLAALAVMALAFGALAQTRTDTYDAADVAVSSLVLWPLEDGGCSARACGSVRQVDGGAGVAGCTEAFNLRAVANLNRCNGLVGAAVPRLQRALDFDVDGGAP